MPVIFFHRTRESTEYTVLTHIGVWVKTKINIKLLLYRHQIGALYLPTSTVNIFVGLHGLPKAGVIERLNIVLFRNTIYLKKK